VFLHAAARRRDGKQSNLVVLVAIAPLREKNQ
jgi:hypothetical protein